MTPEELADRLERAAKHIGPALQRHVKDAGDLGNALIRGNASGRPGPNVRSEGDNYRNSWQTVPRAFTNGVVVTIGTQKPQGRRLEFGYYDMTDSLGRHYFQPPFPHVQPALPRIESALRVACMAALQEVLL